MEHVPLVLLYAYKTLILDILYFSKITKNNVEFYRTNVKSANVLNYWNCVFHVHVKWTYFSYDWIQFKLLQNSII